MLVKVFEFEAHYFFFNFDLPPTLAGFYNIFHKALKVLFRKLNTGTENIAQSIFKSVSVGLHIDLDGQEACRMRVLGHL